MYLRSHTLYLMGPAPYHGAKDCRYNLSMLFACDPEQSVAHCLAGRILPTGLFLSNRILGSNSCCMGVVRRPRLGTQVTQLRSRPSLASVIYVLSMEQNHAYVSHILLRDSLRVHAHCCFVVPSPAGRLHFPFRMPPWAHWDYYQIVASHSLAA